ncbi:MAG: patatin-like phospholipase family protein [Burkholderiaceae bacterium]|jgi:NTE family protein|nr:patatin-like phospholipase family protein [Burkholderiaceae bacterium]
MTETSHSHPDGPRAHKTANLALQGGGAHGAFTWGVLDALLEDGRLRFEGVSGASAGAMNAVVLAHGLARAHADGLRGQARNEAARRALTRFWDGVGVIGTFMSGLPMPGGMQAMMGGWWAQWFSPAQANPLGLNPLRRLIERQVDFGLLAHASAQHTGVQVFVSATNIRTGRGEVFSGQSLTADAVMASACLPMLFQPVQIGGEYYWDGGYSGNPALHPLIYKTASRDVVLVQINPIESPWRPGASAQDIMERINEITFNASLLAEMRAIDFVQRLLDEGRLDPARYRSVLLHRVDGGAALAQFGAASKMRADAAFLQRLCALGRHAGKAWLAHHWDDLGRQAGVENVESIESAADGALF